MSVAALMTEPPDSVIRIKSDVLGPLDVPRDRVVRFPEGLLGFPETRDFVLVAASLEGTFWLQSAEHSSLIFLLVDPFRHFDDYAVDLTAADLAALEGHGPGDIAILAIVTLPGADDAPCTVNLQGPVALNLNMGRGRQVILRGTDAGLRRPILLETPTD